MSGRGRDGERSHADEGHEVELSSLDGAVELWSAIVQGCRAAGYDTVGTEYLRLSQVLVNGRRTELAAGDTGDQSRWDELAGLGAEAVELLGPLVAAAQLLTELPDVSTPPGTSTRPTEASHRPARQSRPAPARQVPPTSRKPTAGKPARNRAASKSRPATRRPRRPG